MLVTKADESLLYAPQVSGDVLQGLPGNPAARQPLHQPVFHDAGLGDARVAVVRRHRLHPQDLGPGQDGAGGPRLFHEADERRSPWRLDYENGLDLPHHPPARHELKRRADGNIERNERRADNAKCSSGQDLVWFASM